MGAFVLDLNQYIVLLPVVFCKDICQGTHFCLPEFGNVHYPSSSFSWLFCITMFLSHGLTVAVALVCFFLQLSNVSAARIMIVGDSITHGSEGDYTWRYRLWQWLRNNNVNFEFVGPWQGTFQPNEPLPPQPPLFQGAPTPVQADHVTGGYALDIDAAFDKDHFSHSGRQADQVKNTINAMVSQYQPDYLLVELGFNDIGWFISDAAGLLRNMKTLIDNARAAKPDLRFAVANVPYRTRIGGREDLVLNTDIYNGLLANAIPGWSTAQSPIELVYFRENYSCMSPQAFNPF